MSWHIFSEGVSMAFVEHVTSIHFVVGFVCIIGVVMAYLSEDHSSTTSCYPTKSSPTKSTTSETLKPPTLHTPHTPTHSAASPNSSTTAITSTTSTDPYVLVPHTTLTNLYTLISEAMKPFHTGAIWRRLTAIFQRWLACIELILTARSLKAQAKSRRQLYYMLEKQLLGIPIAPDETEIKSYLDVKRHMGSNWPFMLEVNDVKEQKVEYDGYKCIPFSSYSYLDLVRHQEVQDYAVAAARQYSSGNHGPRMLGGNMQILTNLEKVVADFFGREGALVFATGFLACMSVPCALASEGDIIFADSRAHASLRSGLKLCGAKVFNFMHNDFPHLDKLAKKHRRKYANAWMVIESIYSMDGDIADLPAAVKIAKHYNIRIILDEAHGLGVLGKTGRGLEEHFNLPGAATIICGTFSKSISSIGGYITASKDIVDFLDFHSPGNVFSAPLPAYCAGAAIKSFELIDRESWRVAKLQENARLLRQCLQTGLGQWPADYEESYKYELEGDPASSVIPVVFPDDIDRVIRIAGLMKKRGYMMAAVAFPACALRRPRFRVTATCGYDRNLIATFAAELVRATTEEPPSDSTMQLKNLSIF